MARKKTEVQTQNNEFIPCAIKQLPEHLLVEAMKVAIEQNPTNAPAPRGIRLLTKLFKACTAPDSKEVIPPAHIAVLSSKYWGSQGVDLGVYFMDTNDLTLKNKILTFMNHWGNYGKVKFREASSSNAQVRIARQRNSGYWSYLGTDILSIPKRQPTMNLENFSLSTPDSEYFRVVEHETGHTLGFPHEHMRKEIVNLLDPQKTIQYFESTQGWSAEEVQQQVLTPIEDSTIPMHTETDQTSIMTYQLPGSITTNGQPVVGGSKINDLDGAFAAKIYPKTDVPPTPPPSSDVTITVPKVGTYKWIS